MPDSYFDNLSLTTPDEGFPLLAAFRVDPSPDKVSLGAGVYRDENQLPWVLPVVKKVEKLLQQDINHEYLPIGGLPSFNSLSRNLALGLDQSTDAAAITRIASVQTISGTGANHLAARFLSETIKPRHVWISDPTWANHSLVWTLAGDVQQMFYPYYKESTRGFDFEGMIQCLEIQAVPGDVIILHACAHNPTGVDPSKEQWERIADLCERKGLFPMFDFAYQGYATGNVDEDAWAVRHFFRRGTMEMCIAQSFSKNFGLYGERVGALHLIASSAEAAEKADSQLVRLQRGEISNPPAYGAKIVAATLGDSELRAEWEGDLRTMTSRLNGMRQSLYSELQKIGTPGSWDHIISQIGMFSYSGLSTKQVNTLKERFHIYAYSSGRISITGLTPTNVGYVARAIDSVVKDV